MGVFEQVLLEIQTRAETYLRPSEIRPTAEECLVGLVSQEGQRARLYVEEPAVVPQEEERPLLHGMCHG